MRYKAFLGMLRMPFDKKGSPFGDKLRSSIYVRAKINVLSLSPKSKI